MLRADPISRITQVKAHLGHGWIETPGKTPIRFDFVDLRKGLTHRNCLNRIVLFNSNPPNPDKKGHRLSYASNVRPEK